MFTDSLLPLLIIKNIALHLDTHIVYCSASLRKNTGAGLIYGITTLEVRLVNELLRLLAFAPALTSFGSKCLFVFPPDEDATVSVFNFHNSVVTGLKISRLLRIPRDSIL